LTEDAENRENIANLKIKKLSNILETQMDGDGTTKESNGTYGDQKGE
jgi:hypothetical protein